MRTWLPSSLGQGTGWKSTEETLSRLCQAMAGVTSFILDVQPEPALFKVLSPLVGRVFLPLCAGLPGRGKLGEHSTQH